MFKSEQSPAWGENTGKHGSYNGGSTIINQGSSWFSRGDTAGRYLEQNSVSPEPASNGWPLTPAERQILRALDEGRGGRSAAELRAEYEAEKKARREMTRAASAARRERKRLRREASQSAVTDTVR